MVVPVVTSQILGYQSTQGVIFFVDTMNKVISIEVPQNFAQAITSIDDEDFEAMRSAVEKIENNKFHDKVAKYLEGVENLSLAFEVVKNLDLKFEYALRLELVDEAYEIACESTSKSCLKQIGDLCLQKGEFDKAEDSYKRAEDLPSLFLLYSSLGTPGLTIRRQGRHRVAL